MLVLRQQEVVEIGTIEKQEVLRRLKKLKKRADRIRSHRLMAKTPVFQAGERGSKPLGSTSSKDVTEK